MIFDIHLFDIVVCWLNRLNFITFQYVLVYLTKRIGEDWDNVTKIERKSLKSTYLKKVKFRHIWLEKPMPSAKHLLFVREHNCHPMGSQMHGLLQDICRFHL
jgi:hypothetical protein